MVSRRATTIALASLLSSSTTWVSSLSFAPPPPVSPATGLTNHVREWRGQRYRYQTSGDPERATQSVVLVHGLFVNADHWRETLTALGDDERYVAHALDLLGSGYSSRPPRDSDEARALDGQSGRFERSSSVAENVALGTADGARARVVDVELRHPLDSCYNFYTWAEQICDFVEEVVRTDDDDDHKVTLACNSIGTISSLQAVLDRPDLFDGVFVVSPNFRELHVAEVPFPALTMPAVRFAQRTLRENGRPLFDALAKPDVVKQILREPYARTDRVDDALVDALLTPLLQEGASDVVFDTLSYSAGPLPEQQLADPSFPRDDVPVWVCYGDEDPWTPAARVEALARRDDGVVARVERLRGVGHCPHDEAPELVNPLLTEFLETLAETKRRRATTTTTTTT